MQNTMLDTVVSSNFQDNSSIEYVDSQENPTATIQRDDVSVQDVEDPKSLELIFGQKHNEIDCALCPTAKRACNRAWFSAKQVENWSEMSKMTLWRWLERIEKARRISRVSDMIHVDMSTSTGAVKTTLYNLNVLNQLAMACIDNEKLNDISCKFSDILSEVETTGSYGVTQTQNQSMMLPNFCNPAEAARAWADLYEKNQATELRAITAEAERDEAIRTKAQIGSSREATAMATASAKSRECEKLREQIGDSETYKRATAIPWLSEYFDTRNDGLYNSLAHQLKKIEASMPPEFAHKPSPDTRYGSVKAYHIAVIERLHEIVREKIPVDEKFMAKYRKDVSPKTKNA